MALKKGFNKYTIKDDIAIIHITNRKGEEFEIVIDIEDLDRLIKADLSWHVHRKKSRTEGYYGRASEYLGKVNGNFRSKTIKIHEFIMNPKDGEFVDHINHDTLDNRKSNLRIVNNKKNTRNRKGANKNNTSGYRNVSFVDDAWAVQLQVNGTNKVLGKFDDVHKAGEFAELMREKYYGEYAGKS